MKRCYIAGKIGNLPVEEYTANFETAEAEVQTLGMVPVLPLKLDHNHDKQWRSFMKVDLCVLVGCDCVYALRNWRESTGATIEVDLAQKLEMHIIYQL